MTKCGITVGARQAGLLWDLWNVPATVTEFPDLVIVEDDPSLL